jgi:hypothetical protein
MWAKCEKEYLDAQQLIISPRIHHTTRGKQSLRLFLFAVCPATVAIGSHKIESMKI